MSEAQGFTDYELKYALHPAARDTVAAYLRQRCRPDPAYPVNEVISLYFDTPDLRCMFEKLNGDRYKTKVRVRWYADDRGESPAWVEMKRRSGAARSKVRLATRRSGAEILADRHFEPDRMLVESGHLCPRPLAPTLLVRYRRLRFVEPFSGARVCIDSGLSVAAPSSPRATRSSNVSGAVVEVKGRSATLPPALQGLADLGLRRSAFSKYGLAAQVEAA